MRGEHKFKRKDNEIIIRHFAGNVFISEKNILTYLKYQEIIALEILFSIITLSIKLE